MILVPYRDICSLKWLKCQASRKIPKLTIALDSVLRPLYHIDTFIYCKSAPYSLHNYAVAIKN